MKENSVELYIASREEPVQQILKRIRTIILKHAKDAEESMAYGMPAYRLHGQPLVYFAAMKNHIGFYATPTGHEKFKEKLSKYKQGKGSVQFQLTEKIPYALIEEIVKFRVAENLDLKK